MKLATKKEIEEIKTIFLKKYQNAKTELNYKNEYELLVSIILSAQCTDKRVNIITPYLFEKFPDTESLSKADLIDVENFINSCSFYKNKAKYLIAMAIKVEKDFLGEIPKQQKELMSLKGVGQKTANVFMIETMDSNLMAVDTHVFRVSHRLGLTNALNVAKTEKELSIKFRTDLNQLHQAMVLFGRYICKSLSPDCEKCIFPEYLCKSKESFNPNKKIVTKTLIF